MRLVVGWRDWMLTTVHKQEVFAAAEVSLQALAVRCRPLVQFLSHLKHDVKICD